MPYHDEAEQCRAHGARLARFHKWKVVSPCPVTAAVPRLSKRVLHATETPMANALILDAPPKMFDDFPSILDDTEFDCSPSSSDSIVRGVRRKDTASYDITRGSTCVHIAMERRLGNPTMFVAVIPTRKTFWRRDASSERLAEQIVELLIAHGADDSP